MPCKVNGMKDLDDILEEISDNINERLMGKKNSNAKSWSVMTHRGRHKRVATKRGPASAHKCAVCGKNQATEWAEKVNAKGVGDYTAMCRSCHSKKDGKAANWNKDKYKKQAAKRPMNDYTAKGMWKRK